MYFKNTMTKIYNAVSRGTINPNHIKSKDLRNIGIDESTSSTFMPKHRIGNPGGNPIHFERINRGTYRFNY